MTAEDKFDLPETHNFEQISNLLKNGIETKPKAGLVVGSDVDTLAAFVKAVQAGLIAPVMIGDEKLARKKADENNLDINNYEFVDINEPEMAIKTCFKMALAGEIDFIVKGRISNTDFIDIILDPDSGFYKPQDILSHITIFKPASYPKLLFVTDSYVNVEPDLKEKIGIINNAINLAHKIKIKTPAVALLSAVEAVSPQMPVTVDAAIISKMSERNQIKGAYVDGPLSFDIAIDDDAARGKGITESKVAGQADILVASDMATSNGIIKAMSLFTNSPYGGVLVGGKVPVSFCCSYDNVDNRYNSILLAAAACL